MSFTELLLIAFGLSMDAFAVSICKGLSVRRVRPKHYLAVGLYFGGFQALMPFLGYILGYKFTFIISRFDYIVAFVLLAVIGANMIKESRSDDNDEDEETSNFSPKAMLPLAVATSIDALAVGITFAALGCGFSGGGTHNIFFNITTTGITTFIISAVGIKIGNIFGTRYKSRAELVGGVVLICIGLKIFAEHFI